MTRTVTTTQAYVAAISGGLALWVAISLISGRTEAWDSSLYWALGYPLALLLAGTLSYLAPERPWRWGLAIMLSQAAVLTIMAADFGLLPLGMLLFGVLSLPPIAVAKATAGIRLRRGNG